MRLLHFDELGKLILTNFDGKTTPPYAILSHRWNDSEILMQDVLNGAYKKQENGLKKLEFCAKQAAQDGLEYFWIDTCCIDKWNLHELSRAINLMFQWYKNAAHCYVFLSDVSTETPECNDWEASFRASAWFTRGWTLQELIAPASVKFFSCEGKRIGDKTSLGELIHDVTNIPLAALRDCSLEGFTTYERMRWVQSRRTKEEEDIVYCLLGILGVSMPVVYGEGREIAQRRLEGELEAVGNAPSIIPFSQNPGFVGRDSQLAAVEAMLFSSEQTTTLAIVGLGGTGKSQLALEVAHRTRQKIRNCSVFWIDASDKDRLYQSYASVAQKLNIAGWDDDHADMERVIQDCVASLSARQCLLMFDNAEDTTLQSGGSSNTGTVNLTDCLPQSKLCSAIFTTTNADTAEVLASRNIITLQELPPKMALKMLTDRLARPLSNAELQEAEPLLRELLYLPLAVFQAAACMNTSNMTVQEYRSQLDKLNKAATRHSDTSAEIKLQDPDTRGPVATTLSVSIDQISRDNSLAVDYLFLAACVDRKDIPLDLFEAASIQVREDAVKVLEMFALVTRRPADSAFDIHRLVHQALREWLAVRGRLGEWTRRTIAQLDRVYPIDDHSNRSKWRRLLPHAQYALLHGMLADDDKRRLSLLWKYSATLYAEGRYKEFEELEKQGLQISIRVYGEEHRHTLIAKSDLALAYLEQGCLEEAEELETQNLQVHRRIYGDKHPETLTSMANLASVYWQRERVKEAEELEEQVLQGRKEFFGEEHSITFLSMANLASTYRIQGRLAEAEELNMEAMEGRKRVLGEEHPDTLFSMHSVALVWYSLDRHEEAFALLEKCVQLRQRILGNQHPDTQIVVELLNEWRA
ncbi:hypothetical protein yc1106_08813 [Curvularia clavata]|uniref:Uncharacterized protein n=1 Tax=Curvularia clavata TaxID=95742 RepID=A0A9Q8ZF54_CURCL|nr:hypothetical protein yc1106_08813 [Curvularia clavata]